MVDEKKVFQERSRRKRKEMARLRRALAEVESEDNELQDSIARLEEISSNMVRREMRALGVLEDLPEGSAGAFADPDQPWAEVPFNETIDWDLALGGSSAAVVSSGPSGSGDSDDIRL